MLRKVMYAAALIAAPVAAQDSQTTCTTNVGITNCTTHAESGSRGINWGAFQPPATQSPMDAFMQGRRAREEMDRQAAERAAANALAEQANEQYRTRQMGATNRVAIGGLLRDGKCDAAITLALESGDIELANQTKAFCATPHQ